MKKMFFLLLIVISVIVGCGGGGNKDNDLPVNTIQWQDDGNGYIQFYTNDKNNYGKAYFCALNNTDSSSTFTIEVKKVTGAKNFGYGIIMNFVDLNNFKCILIDTYGYYTIYNVSGGQWTATSSWQYITYLNTGLDVINTIQLYCGVSNSSTIKFNGNSAISVGTTKGKFGFIACIGSSNDENFPNVPEDIRFKVVSTSQTTNNITTYQIQSSTILKSIMK